MLSFNTVVETQPESRSRWRSLTKTGMTPSRAKLQVAGREESSSATRYHKEKYRHTSPLFHLSCSLGEKLKPLGRKRAYTRKRPTARLPQFWANRAQAVFTHGQLHLHRYTGSRSSGGRSLLSQNGCQGTGERKEERRLSKLQTVCTFSSVSSQTNTQKDKIKAPIAKPNLIQNELTGTSKEKSTRNIHICANN